MRFFKKKTTPPPNSDTQPPKPAHLTRLGPSFQLKGQIAGADDVVFEGRLDGHIDIQGHLTLPDGAVVNGDLTADTIDMAGSAEGRLTAGRKIVIRRSSRIKGHLEAPALHLQAGARFDGKIAMGPSSAYHRSKQNRISRNGK